MSAEYVRRYYAVSFKRGDRVVVNGRPGKIVSFPGAYIAVRFDGERLVISTDEPGYSESISLRIPALTTRPEPAADAVDVFDAADSDSWPPPEMKDAPFIRYLHKIMKYHQPTITPQECWVAIGAVRMWMSRHPDRASETLQAAGSRHEPGRFGCKHWRR